MGFQWFSSQNHPNLPKIHQNHQVPCLIGFDPNWLKIRSVDPAEVEKVLGGRPLQAFLGGFDALESLAKAVKAHSVFFGGKPEAKKGFFVEGIGLVWVGYLLTFRIVLDLLTLASITIRRFHSKTVPTMHSTRKSKVSLHPPKNHKTTPTPEKLTLQTPPYPPKK